MKAIVRHWHILRMIPGFRQRKKTAGEIHAALLNIDPACSLTKRTVERNLHDLAGIFPLEFDGKKPQGWNWRRDAKSLDIPGMDIATALTLCMAESYLTRLLPQNCLTSLAPHMTRAHELLGNPDKGGLADWPEKIRVVPRTQPLLPPNIEEKVIVAVYESLLVNRRLQGHYRPAGKTAKQLEISPLGLVFNDPIVYLVGTCWDYEDIRLFALHRFTSAEPLEIAASRPADFSLQDYIDGGALGFASQQGKTIRLKARFTQGAAAHLLESPLAEDQTVARDSSGWVMLQASVADTEQLLWWLLGFGAQVEVLEPLELRGKIIKILREQEGLYDLKITEKNQPT